jgi:hypothetical protein
VTIHKLLSCLSIWHLVFLRENQRNREQIYWTDLVINGESCACIFAESSFDMCFVLLLSAYNQNIFIVLQDGYVCSFALLSVFNHIIFIVLHDGYVRSFALIAIFNHIIFIVLQGGCIYLFLLDNAHKWGSELKVNLFHTHAHNRWWKDFCSMATQIFC